MPRIDAALSPLADAALPVVDARPGRDAFVSPLACGAPETLGGSCRLGGCIPRWGCTTEQSYAEPSVRRDGTPGRSYPVRTSIGGQCRGSCDPEIEASCPSCASCVESQLAPVHECLARCLPEAGGRGGCRDGYACDRARVVCVDACDVVADVDTCQFTFEDRDAEPGRETIVDEGVEYPSRCDLVTGSVRHDGTDRRDRGG